MLAIEGTRVTVPTVRRIFEPIIAFILATCLYMLAGAVAGLYPFGEDSQQFGDLATQFVPYAGLLRDIAGGGSELSGVSFTWTVGMGVPSYSNYATYFSNPIWALMVLFPTTHIQLGLWLITVLMIGIASLSMALLLRALVPHGHSVWLVALATSYGLCGWTVIDADYMPMWLAGLAGLPILVLCGLWASANRRFAVSVVLIALVWYSNYYTAYMASIGAAIILSILLKTQGLDARGVFRGLLSFLSRGILGVGIAALILVPAFLEIRETPSDLDDLIPRDFPLRIMLSHIFPGSGAGFQSPSFFVGSLALILALLFLVERGYDAEKRFVWLGGLSLTIISMSVQPFLHIWHLADVPNGNSWRSAFVVSAIVVIMAWLGVQEFQSLTLPRFVVVGSALLILVILALWTVWVGENRAFSRVGLISTAFIGILLFFIWVFNKTGLASIPLALFVSIVVCIELVGNTVFVEKHFSSGYPLRNPELNANFDVHKVEWPTYRADIQEYSTRRVSNGGATFSVPTVNYYSSGIPETTSTLLREGLHLGAGDRTRIVVTPLSDPIGQRIASVAYVYGPEGEKMLAPFPMVRATAPLVDEDSRLSAPFVARNEVIGTSVYSPPIAVDLIDDNSDEISFNVSCPAGGTVSLDASNMAPTIFDNEDTFSLVNEVWSPWDLTDDGPRVIRVDKNSLDGKSLEGRWACADNELLDSTIAATEVPTIEAQPGKISASFKSGQSSALVATSAFEQWRCETPNGQALTRSLYGLLVVDLDGASSFSCAYENPGVTLGRIIASVSLLITGVIGGFSTWRRLSKSRSIAVENEGRDTKGKGDREDAHQ